MSSYPLKPCPFCGSKEVFTMHRPAQLLMPAFWVVKCRHCLACAGIEGTEIETVAAWNSRPTEEALTEALYQYTNPDGCFCDDETCRMCRGEAAMKLARGTA